MSISTLAIPASPSLPLPSLVSRPPNVPSPNQLNEVLKAFDPSAVNDQSNSSATSENGSSSTTGTSFSAESMTALISAQEQQASAGGEIALPQLDRPSNLAKTLFTKIDGDGDGKISASEFEKVFGSNADKAKVNDLFDSIDTDGDGSLSQNELATALQMSDSKLAGQDLGLYNQLIAYGMSTASTTSS
jgi:hypothetical protein